MGHAAEDEAKQASIVKRGHYISVSDPGSERELQAHGKIHVLLVRRLAWAK